VYARKIICYIWDNTADRNDIWNETKYRWHNGEAGIVLAGDGKAGAVLGGVPEVVGYHAGIHDK